MEEFTKVLVLNNETEARLLDAVLEERGVPHLMRSYHDRAYDGLWQAQRGWGHVEAPPSWHEQIQEIYRDLSSNRSGSGGSGEDRGSSDESGPPGGA
jgi:hypothetical protein